MVDKSNKKKKKAFDFSNPYNLWGIMLVIIGAAVGGAIGGGVGGGTGAAIIMIGKKDISHIKKIGICLLLTCLGIFVYIFLASLFLSFISK